MCLNQKILYQYYVVFVPLGITSPLKTVQTTDILLDTDGHEHKFDICQGTGITIYFKIHTKLCPHFFQEKNLSDIQSEIHLD